MAESGALYMGGIDPEREICLRCGSIFLDTGWECTDCGYDNLPHYAKPKDMPALGGGGKPE